MRLTLRGKILLLAVVAPLLLAAGSLKLVNDRVSGSVRSSIDEALHRSALVCESIFDARRRMLDASARVIAQDPRFFASLALPASTPDAPFRSTVRGVAGDFNEIAAADIFDVIDSRDRLIASVGEVSTSTAGRRRLLKALRSAEPRPDLLVENGVLYLVCVKPVTASGRPVGTLILGTRLGDEVAEELQSMTRSEISILAGSELSGTTLASAEDREQLRAATADSICRAIDPVDAGVFSVNAMGTTYLTLVRPVPGVAVEAPGVFVLQRSLNAETAFLRDVQRGLGELGLVILTAALLLGLIVAHKITRPIQELVRGAEEIERGNYEYPLGIRTRDEIEYLARRFEDMREHERRYIGTLKEVDQLKSEFIDLASHELRTPTTVIKGYTELLGEGKLGRMTARQRDAVAAIESQVEGIVRIAESATWMAQIEGERPVLNREVHPVETVLREALEVARAAASGRDLEMEIDVDGDLRAEVDGPRLGLAVNHLIQNGIRFTPDGGRIHLRARAEGKTLILEVEDTGIGIDPDRARRLLGRSFLSRDVLKHHSSSGLGFRSAGLGLGLPIALGVVQAHEGTLEIDSREGGGSCFRIRIPGVIPADQERKAA